MNLRWKGFGMLGLLGILCFCTAENDQGCDNRPQADAVQHEQQETIIEEGNRQVGMPAIKNFRERKIMKEILELRDQSDFTTYTYLYNEMTGKVGEKLCDSIGYPIPYATQFTNPMQPYDPGFHDSAMMPQADPNGLFSPASADGTWVMCISPKDGRVKAVYSEPRVIALPWPHEEK